MINSMHSLLQTTRKLQHGANNIGRNGGNLFMCRTTALNSLGHSDTMIHTVVIISYSSQQGKLQLRLEQLELVLLVAEAQFLEILKFTTDQRVKERTCLGEKAEDTVMLMCCLK